MNQQKHQQMKTSVELCLFWKISETQQLFTSKSPGWRGISCCKHQSYLCGHLAPAGAHCDEEVCSTLWGERMFWKVFWVKRFFELWGSLPNCFFYPKNITLNISYIILPLSTMHHEKTPREKLLPWRSLSWPAFQRATRSQRGGEDESWTYLDLLDLVGLFWVNFGRHFTHNHKKDPDIFYPRENFYR